jgi:hypothetical protein
MPTKFYLLKFYFLIFVAILAFLSGAFVAWNRLFLTPYLVTDSLWALNKWYGPNHDPQVGYKELYDYAMQITNNRNSQVLFYQSIICVLFIFLSIILVLWSRDVKKQKRNTT